MTSEVIEEIIANHTDRQGSIMTILEDIQNKFNYLPEEALKIVARQTGRSLVDIYGVATFYKAFSLKPRGKHLISCCQGTACHVRGGQAIAEEFKRELNIEPGETTADNEITFETVNCLGACALGPIVVSDGHYSANVNKREIRQIIQQTKDGTYESDKDATKNTFPLEVSCPQCGRSLMDHENHLHGHPAVLINVSAGDHNGRVRFSSLYGNFTKTYEHDISANTAVKFFCPHCGSGFPSSARCIECGDPMADMSVNGKDGVLSICTRKECNGQMLDLNKTTID
ncbi:MAG TPA: NAD(P)H-dependent oxidoreductase subunit E [Smithellaceae bacterium]|nr:NAD(P)H-dependent oxidoreductase subunit E [Smithellaceae bacterium]